ncbi:hypothetical protein BCV70DRAFT_155790 [Testicularia cyperi]|uniref:RING-type domain-containing protein n=1 Tax=Testicularia cyperi TaxID=1882483 RepID=A0A317Y026_9BASI|nr:hypothetical protein BCV70DRAFT_155790 [Testicularia cyperi]
MGCSICLDVFGQDGDDRQRPTALPCGHIFHYECLNAWFYGNAASSSTGRSAACNHRCPLCAKATAPTSMIKLFPSEGDDLDVYLLALQRQPSDDKTSVHESCNCHTCRPKTEESSRNLLSSLLDFSRAIQGYVMSGHQVRVESHINAGIKVKRLFDDLQGPDSSRGRTAELEQAMAALETAVRLYDNLATDLNKQKRSISSRLNDARKKCRDTVELMKRAEQLQAQAERNYQLAQTNRHRASQALARADILERNLQQRNKAITERESQLAAMARDMESARRQSALETSMKLSSMEVHVKTELANMQRLVDEALRKASDADKERNVIREKNNYLANQMRDMKAKMKLQGQALQGTATAARSTKTARQAASLTSGHGTMTSLYDAMPSQTARRPHRWPSTPGVGDNLDLTRSSSPGSFRDSPSPETPTHTHIDLTQSSSPQSSVVRTARKRHRNASLYIEEENLDDEMDDLLFPMPGVVVSSRTRHPAVAGSRKELNPVLASVDSNPGQLRSNEAVNDSVHGHTNKHVTSGNSSRTNSTTSLSRADSTDKLNYPWLSSITGVVLGPKRKPNS